VEDEEDRSGSELLGFVYDDEDESAEDQVAGLNRCSDGGMPSQIIGFSWLPQYHDLGLVYAAIAPFAGGWKMHMMSPIDFIQKPLLWLELMSRHRVSWGIAPDFAYRLVTCKFIEARNRAGGKKNPIPGLDLSSIRYLTNTAEPVRLDTSANFSDLFCELYGLRDNWIHTGYGLAENVVGCCYIHGYHLSSPRDEDRLSLVAVGSRATFDASLAMKIVCPETCKECKDGETGELWIAGPSVAAGYYG
jgi:acyl-CoA synthetase (AMP-forming)/AMP-acid ligase II